MPSADFCAAFGGSPPSRQSDHKGHGRQRRRPPEVSLTAFRTQPPEFTWGALDGYGLRESHARSSRARPPRIRFLYIGSCVCSTLPSDPTSRLVTPLRLATLHLHQVGRGLSPPSDQTCSAQVGQAFQPVIFLFVCEKTDRLESLSHLQITRRSHRCPPPLPYLPSCQIFTGPPDLPRCPKVEGKSVANGSSSDRSRLFSCLPCGPGKSLRVDPSAPQTPLGMTE